MRMGSSTLFALSTRMMLFDRFTQMRAHNVCVNLCSSNIGVSEHGLHAAQIGPPFKKMSRKGMSQDMGAEPAAHTRRTASEPQEFPKTLPRHRLALCRDKQIGARTMFQELGARPLQVLPDRSQRFPSHRNEPLLIPFANDPDHSLGAIQVRNAQPDQLAYAHAGRI